MTLNEIGLKYGTDKASNCHNYLFNYERELAWIKNREFVMWEIGVAEKRSLLMWREYFPNAKVYGIDINPECAGEGVFIGSQSDEAFLSSVLAQTGRPAVIIDDGSHKGHDIKKTFRFLFGRLMTGGIYAIEDAHCFYDDYYASDSNVYQFFSDMGRHVDVNGRGMTGNTEVAINWHDNTRPLPEYSRDMKAMHVYPSLWIFERK